MTSRSPSRRLFALGLGFAAAVAAAAGFATWHRRRPLVTLQRRAATVAQLLREERTKYPADWRTLAGGVGNRHLPRFPIPEEIARRLFPVNDAEQPWDPWTYVRHLPGRDQELPCPERSGGTFRMRTNSLGMREDTEPSGSRPDLRILVTGDSHTDGVCDNAESFANVLEGDLARARAGDSIEVLNAGKGGFTFYSHLGTLEKFASLHPDVFVVAVYGPNDFEEALTPFHWFEGTSRPGGATEYWDLVERALAIRPTWLAQEGLSLKYFQRHPGETAVALRAAESAMLDIQELCRERSADLVVVYLPSLFDALRRSGAPEPALARSLRDALELGPGDLGIHDRMADDLLAFLGRNGISCIDGRALFAGRDGPFHWLADFHLNVAGHRLVGEALAAEVARLRALRPR